MYLVVLHLQNFTNNVEILANDKKSVSLFDFDPVFSILLILCTASQYKHHNM
jgi:hypothetical protein